MLDGRVLADRAAAEQQARARCATAISNQSRATGTRRLLVGRQAKTISFAARAGGRAVELSRELEMLINRHNISSLVVASAAAAPPLQLVRSSSPKVASLAARRLMVGDLSFCEIAHLLRRQQPELVAINHFNYYLSFRSLCVWPRRRRHCASAPEPQWPSRIAAWPRSLGDRRLNLTFLLSLDSSVSRVSSSRICDQLQCICECLCVKMSIQMHIQIHIHIQICLAVWLRDFNGQLAQCRSASD